ncbi:MAG: ABC transporter substrate-binding protein [Deltaproteobacteria bacterium]|nr:ABC transporter substrate-binding protein [Deltaproteobacteria bacterium]
MRRLIFRLFTGAVFLLAAWLFHSRLLAADKIHIGYSAISAAAAQLWAAQEKGFFRKYGLETELVYLAGGSRVVLAMEAGSVQIGMFNVGAAVEARLAGGSTLVTGSVYDVYYFQIFAKPAIHHPKDLKGKVIAASRAGAASEYGIRDALAHFGLKENDYKIIYVGGTDARVQALQQGLVDASIISPPNGLIAQKLGFRELVNLMQMKLPFGYFGIGARETWLRQNRDVMRNFLRGYLEGLALCRRDREYALRLIGKFSHIDDREILLESYRTSIPYIPERPYVRREIIEAALKLSKREGARNADPEKFYDNSLVKELDGTGFIASLFGKN